MLKIVIYKDKKKEWRFRVVARNGRILCHSEGYTRKENCIKSAKLLNDLWYIQTKED